MRRSQKSKVESRKLFVGLKMIILMTTVLLLSTCAMFQDFLAPSDLVNSLEAQNGIRIDNTTISPSLVRNTGSDEFSIECDISSKPSIKNVTVDLSAIGGYSDTYLRADAKNPKHWTVANLTISENYDAENYKFTITAVNNQDYTNTETVSISVISVSNYFVSTNGDDSTTSDGSVNSPFATIQHAITEATNYGVKKVYVSAGTYTNQNNGHCVELKAGVAIYGGYSSDFNERNIANNPTIIDGKSNVNHVVVAEDVQDTASGINGFVITGGNATNIDNENGAGIKLEGTSVFVKNCIIISNHSSMDGGGLCGVLYEGSIVSNKFIHNSAMSGGGVYLSHSTFNFIDNTITNNSATFGGGIYFSSCSPTIINATIVNNTATNGGGMYLDKSSPDIKSNNIVSNNASINGGGMYLTTYSSPDITDNAINSNTALQNGGGLYIESSSPKITNNTISYNNSILNGGGIYLYLSTLDIIDNTINYNSIYGDGGGLYIDNSSPTLTNNSISYNSATNGGGIYFWQSSPTNIVGNTINSNSAGSGGGGIFIDKSSPIITSNIISSNSAGSGGGGIHIFESSPTIISNTVSSNSAGSGGGMYINKSSPTIIGNTITFNFLYGMGSGGGLYLEQSSPVINGNTICYNSADNGGGGGMYITASSPMMIANTICYNSANDGSGLFLHNKSTPTNIQNLILDNWASISRVIDITGSSIFKSMFISNIIGSTNGDTNHYGIYEADATSGHTLQYNFFVTNALGFLYKDSEGSVVSNGADWTNINDTGWTGATVSEGNVVTNYIDATNMWSSWQ